MHLPSITLQNNSIQNNAVTRNIVLQAYYKIYKTNALVVCKLDIAYKIN